MDISRLKKLPAGFRSFLLRIFLFCALFIALTGIVGPWIIATRLLYGFHFFIYGNMGKMILFSAIAFLILSRDTIAAIKKRPYDNRNIGCIILSFALIPVFFRVATRLLDEPTVMSNLPLAIGTHLLAVSLPLFLIIGVFGLPFITYFTEQYRRVILICLALSIGFYLAIFQVWKLWPFLSAIVLHAVAFLLSLHLSPVREVAPLTLYVQDFAVRIEQACSGVESIFLFSSLYVLIALVDWQKFNRKKLILAFVPALAGLFIVNILRVALLIEIGVFFSPEITLKLFHTYLGMVFFIIYFALFWGKAYRWMRW